MSNNAHGHHHHHHHHAGAGDRRVFWAVVVNVGLTVAQIVGGIVAGSLSLIADALHNFSDAVSLVIAFVARRIARRPSDEHMTFGYVRAEIVAALINYTTLILVGFYLVYEAILRFVEPQPVAGWIIVVIAAVALAVDLVTALLTYALSKESMNIRAAFLHNLADALGSVAVIVAGTLIITRGWHVVDPIATLLIAGYILWMAFREIGGAIRMLMLGTPPGVDVGALVEALRVTPGVADLHHVHVWAIDENENALEAHIVVEDGLEAEIQAIKTRLKALARDGFGISHSTLEFEHASDGCDGETTPVIGHAPRSPHGGGHPH